MTSDEGQNRAGNPLGPTGERVMRNVERLRKQQRMTYRELSEDLRVLGRPIPELGLARIERGKRRVDADDLVALALVLRVTPNTLLMPVGASDEVRADLTDAVGDEEWLVWRWADGQWPLMTEEQKDAVYDQDIIDDFKRRARPARLRRISEHRAARTAESVIVNIENVLRTADVRGTPVPDILGIKASRATAASAPESLRGVMYRLNTEVTKLLAETTQEDPGVLARLNDLMARHSRTLVLEEIEEGDDSVAR